jgi:hypothetical protein
MKYSLESDARKAVRLSFIRVCSIQDRSQKTDAGGRRKIKKEIIIFKKAYEFAGIHSAFVIGKFDSTI